MNGSKRVVAGTLLAVLVAAPLGFLVWLNTTYGVCITLPAHASGWQIADGLLDLLAFIAGGWGALMGLLALCQWITYTLWP